MHNINPNYNTIPIKYTEFIKFPENKENKDIIFNDKYLSSVLSVHQYAFANSFTLSNMYIPTNVLSIGENAFANSLNIELFLEHYKSESDLYKQSFNWGIDYDSIHFLSAEYQTFSTNDVTFLYTYDNSIKGNIIYGVLEKDISSLEIPSHINGIPVLEIGANAFRGMSNLTSVNIPETVSVLNEYCFYKCFSSGENNLSIIIPSSVCEIKRGAFQDCRKMSGVYFMSEYNNDNEISTFNDQENGCGYHNYFTGNFDVTLKKVKCNLSSIDDAAFYSSNNISKIEYVWKDNSENLCYQHSISAENAEHNGIIFCNDNFAIIYDNTSLSSYKSWNYYSGIQNCNFIFELKANSYSNENDFKSCFYPEKKFDVRLLYGAVNSATNLTNPLYEMLTGDRLNGGQHECPIIPCYIALFFGKFIGFGKHALERFCLRIGSKNRDNGIRMALFFLDNSTIEPSLVFGSYDADYYLPLSGSIQVKSEVFNDIVNMDGTFIYEANIGALLLAFNCLILSGYNFDRGGIGSNKYNNSYNYYDIYGNISSITWEEMWNSKQIGNFRQFSFYRTESDGQLTAGINTYDNTYGISKIGDNINSFNEELISIGSRIDRWPAIDENFKQNFVLKIKNLSEISSFENYTINSKNLSAIGSYAFNGNNGIRNVIFEKNTEIAGDNFDHIVEFKDSIFRSCNNISCIKGLDLLTNLSSIGEACFYYISSLLSLDLGNSKISNLYNSTFRDATNLSTLYLPPSLNNIVTGTVFTNTPKLSTIYFGSPVNKTDPLPQYNDFYKVSQLSDILSNDTNVGNFLFKCKTDNSVKKTTGVVTLFAGSVNDPIHLDFSKVDKAKVTGNRLSILQYAFQLNNKISSVTTSNKISVGQYAFSGSSKLTELNIGDETHLGLNCFSDISSLSNITIGRNVTYSDNTYDGFFRNIYDVFNQTSFSNVITVNLSNNNTIDFIPKNLCKNNTNLTSFLCPENTVYIGENAFAGCSNLNNIDLSYLSNLLAIESSAFYDCSNLTSITIPSSVKYIGENAFLGCSDSLSIYIDQLENESPIADLSAKLDNDNIKIIWKDPNTLN